MVVVTFYTKEFNYKIIFILCIEIILSQKMYFLNINLEKLFEVWRNNLWTNHGIMFNLIFQ